MMCRLLGVTRSGFYNYQTRERRKPDNAPYHNELLDWVVKTAESSNFTYGSRRMQKALNALGYPVGRRKARSLLREANVFVRYRKRYKVTTNSNHQHPFKSEWPRL